MSSFWTKEIEEAFVQMFQNENLTYAEMADKLGTNAAVLKARAQKLGMKKVPTPVPYTQKELKKIRELYEEGMTLTEISKIMGRSPMGLSYQLTKMNVSNRRKVYWDETDDFTLLTLYAKHDLFLSDIAEMMGYAPSTVKKHIAKLKPKKIERYKLLKCEKCGANFRIYKDEDLGKKYCSDLCEEWVEKELEKKEHDSKFRTCVKCGIEKPLTEFHYCDDGKRYYYNKCKICRYEADSIRKKRKREEKKEKEGIKNESI